MLGIGVPRSIIEIAVEELDGVIGWLTLFGYTCYLNPNACTESVDKVLEQAVAELPGRLPYSTASFEL